MPKAKSSTGREFPIGKEYAPPPDDVCAFLLDTLPKIRTHESFESQDLAKRLIELYEGPNKRRFHSIRISDSFPWAYQAGLLDYENRWHQRGGSRIFLWRDAEPEDVERILTARPTILNGEVVRSAAPAASASPSPAPHPSEKPVSSAKKKTKKKKKKKKKRKKCCDEPRIVKSRKTGKRRCKNCGRKLKDKKKKD